MLCSMNLAVEFVDLWELRLHPSAFQFSKRGTLILKQLKEEKASQ